MESSLADGLKNMVLEIVEFGEDDDEMGKKEPQKDEVDFLIAKSREDISKFRKFEQKP